jgi:hypothetical protein
MTPEEESKYLRIVEKKLFLASLQWVGIDPTKDDILTKDEEDFYHKWMPYRVALGIKQLEDEMNKEQSK